MYSFGPKSRDISLKCFQQFEGIVQISRPLTRALPKGDHFPRAAALKAGKKWAFKLSGIK